MNLLLTLKTIRKSYRIESNMTGATYISKPLVIREFPTKKTSPTKDRGFEEKLVDYIKESGLRARKNDAKVRYETTLELHNVNPYCLKSINKTLQKENYNRHIQIVEKLVENQLADLFVDHFLNSERVNALIRLLKDNIDNGILERLENNLQGFLSQEIDVYIDYHSFLHYLYILPSRKIQRSDIAIDQKNGKIIIFYNEDNSKFSSKKVSIIVNESDLKISVISREGGLAKLKGTYAAKFPEAYHKIESIMEILS